MSGFMTQIVYGTHGMDASVSGIREWREPVEPHPEPGRPVEIPAATAERAEEYRHMACPRYDACLNLAAKRDWAAFGCDGCEHLCGVSVLPKPPEVSLPDFGGVCVDCGEETPNARAKRCRPCHTALRRKYADANPVFTCETCGKEQRVPPSLVGVRRYCSVECRAKGHTKATLTKTCAVCGTKFHVKPGHASKTLCSVACREKGKLKRRITRQCATCGAEFSGTESFMAGRRYCSRDCYHAMMRMAGAA